MLKSGNLDKFESRSYDGIFLGYPAHSRGYRVYVYETNRLMETSEVTFDEASSGSSPHVSDAGTYVQGEGIFVDEEDEEEDGVPPAILAPSVVPTPTTTAATDGHPEETTSTTNDGDEQAAESNISGSRIVQKRHPPEQIIGRINERVTRSRFIDSDSHTHSALVASFEPKDISHALTDESWINAMHEELENFERNKVWTLVSPP